MAAEAPSPVARAGLVAALLLALIHAALLRNEGPYPLSEDAYISLRYAWNLVHGNGLVFNPGEAVEGFTNPLWTLLGAALLALGLPEGPGLQLAGAACFAGLTASAWRFALDGGARPGLAVGAALITASGATAAWWSQSGLETVAYALALCEGLRRVAGAVRAERAEQAGSAGKIASAGAGLTCAAAVLLRPEALAPLAVVAALAVGLTARRGWRPAATRGLLAGAAAFLVPVAGWQLFRLGYYGEWLPMTFYAKTGDGAVWGAGLAYLRDNLSQCALALLLALAALAPGALRRPAGLFCAALVLFQLLYTARVGGDWMNHGRFLVPALAPAAALGALALERLAARFAPPLLALAVLGACGLGLLPHLPSGGESHEERFVHTPHRYLRAARWLLATTPPDALVATPAIGALGYVSQRPILDVHGLIDPEIARYRDPRYAFDGPAGHRRAHPEYVLERRPELLFLGNVWVADQPLTPEALGSVDALTGTDRFLLGMPAFFEVYEVRNYPFEGQWIGVAVRRDSAIPAPTAPDLQEVTP